MRRTARFPLERVMSELERFIAASGGTFTGLAAETGVNTVLNDGFDPYDHGTEGQVRRSLDKLAAEGALARVRRGQAGPGGVVSRTRQAQFYTPRAYTAAEAAAGKARQAAREEAAGWQRIHEDLSGLGICPDSGPGQPVCLSPATWDKLLSMVSFPDQ